MFLDEEDFENEYTTSIIQHNKKLFTEEVQPKQTKKFLAKDLMAEGFDGEKTYYSNGAIESLTTTVEDIEAKINFTPQGEMKSMEANSKRLSYDDYNNEENALCESNEFEVKRIVVIANEEKEEIKL